uniref:Uncharacterized protein n=1 Tax=Rhizophora mucronata TaxID=61149 RepID=A0A2P2N9A3_RHIMU
MPSSCPFLNIRTIKLAHLR